LYTPAFGAVKKKGGLRGYKPPHPFPPLPLVKGKGIKGIGFNKYHKGGRTGKDDIERWRGEQPVNSL